MLFFLYNLIFPIAFLFFIPGIIYKHINRGGRKKDFSERFAIFSAEKKALLKNIKGKVVWIHSVSVGETLLAVDFINKWKKLNNNISFVISTTTTTGQEIAHNKLADKAVIIFCPVDYFLFVRKTLNLIKPKALIIFETEIWPSLICEAYKQNIKVIQVNARISDHSFKGYRRFSCFINPFLSKVSLSCAQTDQDVERLNIICNDLNTVKTGTMKFDQALPEKFKDVDLEKVFGKEGYIFILGASTHGGEERLMIRIFKELRKEYENLRLIFVPRHAERAPEVVSVLKENNIVYYRRSNDECSGENVECLLADTTGEMLGFMNNVDIVVMGKCFAGNDGGHNIIEPALLGKPIITGKELSNFRFVLKMMVENNAVLTADDDTLITVLKELLDDPEKRVKLGETAKNTVQKHVGATEKTISEIEKIVKL
ncbi:MAG TPA: 3-deoxy-D-manno-octulosonic acid transferase [Victivallales bacterium]|nr:3-deoxy-D-manno-octulosonic acid transferase [Victivallales bacterium]